VKLSIVAPVYNEERYVANFVDRCLAAVSSGPLPDFEIVIVNDGSRDSTAQIVRRKIRDHPGVIKLVELSRNFGQQSAFHAGLSLASGDVVVTLDSDLQDPPEVIPKLVDKLLEGFEVVYARRVGVDGGHWGASGHTGVKALGAYLFHRLMSSRRRDRLPRDVGEFRCMRREFVNHLLSFSEYTIFLPGLAAYLGFDAGFIEYRREQRADRARTSTRSLTARAVDATTSFSIMPINLILILSIVAWSLPLMVAVWIGVQLVAFGRSPSGLLILALLGLVAWCYTLSMLSVIAHYLGRTFLESKRRLRYVVKGVIEKPVDND
jgi:glycosyltransferase involved in cell wall biosynthesis